MTPTELLIGLLVVGTAAFIWTNLRIRETALRAARQLCQLEGLQLLDDSVALSQIKPFRDGDGRLVLERVYEFAYSMNGLDRHSGEVTLHGARVVWTRVKSALPPSMASQRDTIM
jgi:hypothetical protein